MLFRSLNSVADKIAVTNFPDYALNILNVTSAGQFYDKITRLYDKKTLEKLAEYTDSNNEKFTKDYFYIFHQFPKHMQLFLLYQ